MWRPSYKGLHKSELIMPEEFLMNGKRSVVGLALAGVFTLLFSACSGGVSQNVKQEETNNTLSQSLSNSVFSRVSGIWGWTEPAELNCDASPRNFTFGSDNKTMRIEADEPIVMYDGSSREYVEYQVISSDDSSVTLATDKETRVNQSGQIAQWRLVLVDDDTFYWEIDDEPENQWGPVVRCEIF